MTTILPRRGTEAEWSAANPVLAMGEEGYETDTTRWKRGDGVTAWNALAYYQPSWDDVTAKPAVIAAGADQAEARAAIGAGTSDLELGATSGTAKAGDYQPGWTDITSKPSFLATSVVGDGTTDDRASIASSDTSAAASNLPLMLLPGTYRVASGLTITSPVWFTTGAIIKPDSGVTVTLAGGMAVAPSSKIFDHSNSGIVVPKKVEFYRPEWWGASKSADDSQAWIDMSDAIEVATDIYSTVQFGQRVIVPPGVNRIVGVTLSHCVIVAGRGVSLFLPPLGTTSGTVLTVGNYAQLDGGFFATDEPSQAVTCVHLAGSRAGIDGAYFGNRAANSTGLKVGTGSVTTTPVLNNIRAYSMQTSYGTIPSGSVGIEVASPDGEYSNIWVAGFAEGIKGTAAGAGRFTNVHVWGNITGISGDAWDKTQATNVYLDSNYGWGMDVDKMDFAKWDMYVWNNGAGVANTGGVRCRQTAGAARYSEFNVHLDDNTGVGILVDGPDDYSVNAVLASSLVRSGGSLIAGTVGVQTTSATLRLRLSLKGSDAITPLVDGSATTVFEEVSLNAAQTFTNKTINADNNTISNIEVDNFKSTAIALDIAASNNNTTIPTSAAVQSAIDLSGNVVDPTNVGSLWTPSPSYVAGNYYFCNSQEQSGTSATLNTNTMRSTPWQVVDDLNAVRLFVEHTVAGDGSAAMRLGIYADNNGTPGALIVDGGTVSMTGAAAVGEVTINVNLTPGLYWVAGVVQGASATQPTVRVISRETMHLPPLPLGTNLPGAGVVVVGWGRTGISGALPDPFGAASYTSIAPRIGFRAA